MVQQKQWRQCCGSFPNPLCAWGFLFQFFKALVNEDTLLRIHCCSWCFLGCAHWETFVADTKCFWTKSETFSVSATNVARAGKRGNICVGNVSATMCPRLSRSLDSKVVQFPFHSDYVRDNLWQVKLQNSSFDWMQVSIKIKLKM